MNLSRIVYRLSVLNPRIEFFFLTAWMLFYPKDGGKESTLVYFLVLAFFMVLFSLRHILALKNLALSPFSFFLTLFNLVLLLGVVFSVYRYRSLYFYADIFLISFYFMLFFFDRSNREHYFSLLAYLVSAFSAVSVFHYLVPLGEKVSLFFTNPILPGIIGGMGVLIFLYRLLKKFSLLPAGLLVLNLAGVFVSRSKAAFLAMALFSLLILWLKKRTYAVVPIVLAALSFIIPNPIRDAFVFSLTKDPYAFDRVHIWKVSLDIFKNHPLTGVGPGNFEEVSKRYNFKQTKGPAQYFKVPRQSHNDYLKLLAETGAAGLLLLLALGFLILKRIFTAPVFDIGKILLLYLLMQACLFNVLFHAFFFFIFLFLAKDLFERDFTYKSFSRGLKLSFSLFLVFLVAICYLFPLLSHLQLKKSAAARGAGEALNAIHKASFFNPLDANPYFLAASHSFNYFKETGELEFFYQALKRLKKTQQLHRYFSEPYIMESNLYHLVLEKSRENDSPNYVSLEEIVAPLERAAIFDPFNPFTRLRKAQVYLEFGRDDDAEQAALEALEIEPGFVSALYFLHKNFNYFKDENTFGARLGRALAKVKGRRLQPGTYLYELYKLPAGTY